MADIKGKDNSPTRKITGRDEAHEVDVELSNTNRELLAADKTNAYLLRTLISKIDTMQKSLMLSKGDNVIRDGKGSGYRAKVSQFGAIKVFEQGIPDKDDPAISVPQTAFLADINGSLDMRVNASLASPQDFYIQADQEDDLFISTLSFLISDQNAILSNFGSIGELNNGCQLILKTQELGESILADNLTTNFSFIRLCADTPAVSDQVSAFRADNISGNSEGYNCILKINEVFGTKFGLRLRAGTKDRLILRIRDNISQIDAFNGLTFGIRLLT